MKTSLLLSAVLLVASLSVGCLGVDEDAAKNSMGIGASSADAGAGGGQDAGAAAVVDAGGSPTAVVPPSPPVFAAPATAVCPNPVAGTACSNAYGYVYVPGDTAHWCVTCYDWPLPPETAVPAPVYRSACLGTLVSAPTITVECVASCSSCQ